MRTTLTLDEDIAAKLRDTAHRDRKPFKVVVNETLRAGLAVQGKPVKRKHKWTVRTFRSPFKAGIDEAKLNQLIDQLDVDDFVAESLSDKRK